MGPQNMPAATSRVVFRLSPPLLCVGDADRHRSRENTGRCASRQSMSGRDNAEFSRLANVEIRNRGRDRICGCMPLRKEELK